MPWTQVLIILFSLNALAISSPYCEVVADSSNKFFLLPSQSSYLDISRYFRGYNLTFEISSPDNNYLLTPPITIVQQYPISNLTQNETHIALDILSDNQYQYKEQGVLLSRTMDDRIIIRFGELDDDNGIEFKEIIDCFDILMLEYNTALVDCQKVGDPQNTDVILIVKDGVITVGTEKKGNIITENRKLQSYRTQNKTFVLSILLSDFIQDHTLRNQSYINTYIYNHTLNTIQFLVIINWETLGDYQLTISDVDVDPFGFIYLADNSESEDYLIVRFKINDDATLDSMLAFDLNEKPARLTTVFVNGVFLVEVATDESIIEIDWTNEPRLVSSYELPDKIGDILDIQMNEQVIMVSTTTGYYFYGLKQYKQRELLHHFQMKNGVVLLDKVNSYGIFVDDKTSHTYMLSSGSLIISQPTKTDKKNKEDIVFKATSMHGKQEKSCEIVFEITMIKNRYSIYVQKEPPVLFTLQNPANHTVHLEAYYLGSLLTYKPRMVANVKYNVHAINQIKYESSIQDNGDSLGTFYISDNVFVKGTNVGESIVFEVCEYSFKEEKLVCKFLRSIQEQGRVICSLYFKVQEDVVLVYANSLQPGTLKFINILTGSQQYQPITLYENTIPISHLSLSQQIIIITFTKFTSLILYKISNNEIKYFMQINKESFPQQLNFLITTFSPLKVKTGQPRLIYILNNNFIIIMRLTSIDATYISYIQLQVPVNETSIDYKIYKSIITIVLKQLCSVVQYNVINPYHPLFMQQHTLQNHVISELSIDDHINNPYLFITSQYQNDTYIHIYKSNVPAVSAYYYRKIIPKNTFLLSSIVYHTLIIFGASPQQSFGLRVYSSPTISITSESIKDLFKTIRPYGFIIQSQTQQTIFLGSLRIVNYQTMIRSKDEKKHHIFLPLKTKQTFVSLPTEMFTGPIARYSIECKQCQDKIQLQEYTYQISRIPSQNPTQQFIYFTAQMDIIWILTFDSIQVVDDQLQQLSPPIQICTNCTCSNFEQIDYQFIVVFCTRPNSHKFMIVVESLDNININVHRVFQLPNSLVIDNCYSMKVIKNRLFILDNNIEGTGKGEIRVFKIAMVLGSIIRIQLETTLDYSHFSIEQQTNIFGFDIIAVEEYLDGKYYLLMVTLGNKGIGYLCYNSNFQNFYIQGKGDNYNLNQDNSISSYVLDDNQYQQIRFINNYRQDQAIQQLTTNLVVSSTFGCHLQLILSFSLSDTLQLVQLKLINSFNKYGSQRVLNWMVIVGTGMYYPFHLGIAHYNSSTSVFSITLYPIQQQPSNQSINFISSVSIQREDGSDELPLNIVGMMTPFNQESILVHDPISQSNIFYNITVDTMYLVLNYDNISNNVSQITLVASNDYSMARSNIEVTHDNLIPASRMWHIYLIVGIGGLVFVGGLSYGVIKFYLKKKTKSNRKRSVSKESGKSKGEAKVSLLESQYQIDQQNQKRGSINLEQDEV